MASPSLVAARAESPDVRDEHRLVDALRAGDELAFSTLVDTYQAHLLRVARIYVADDAIAEDVVQDTWVRVLRSIDRFEFRSTFKTWIFRILINAALSSATRELRGIPLSRLITDVGDQEPAVAPERFRGADALWAGHWTSFPKGWANTPEASLLASETLTRLRAAIEALPASQRLVVTMRDLDGWTADEVCNAIQISESNQRVLLHRGRSRVRRALEQYFTGN